MKCLSLLLANSLSCLLCLAMPCQSWRNAVRLHNKNLIYICLIIFLKLCKIIAFILIDFFFLLPQCSFFFSLSDLQMSASSRVSLSVWQTAVSFCGLIDIVMAALRPSQAYWCSYNPHTLQGLMSILTQLSLWPHFLLLRDSKEAVCTHLGNVLHMCVLFACERKTQARKGLSLCLNVASKLTSRPFSAVR